MEEGDLNNPRAAKFVVVSCQSTLGASVKAALQREATLQRSPGQNSKMGSRPNSARPRKSTPYNSAPQNSVPQLDSTPLHSVPQHNTASQNAPQREAASNEATPPAGLLEVVSSDTPFESVQQLDPDLLVLDVESPDAALLGDLLKNRGRCSLLILCATSRLLPSDPELAALFGISATVNPQAGLLRILGPEVSVADVLAHCQQILYGAPARAALDSRPSPEGRTPLGRPPFDSRSPQESRAPAEGRAPFDSRAPLESRPYESRPGDGRAYPDGQSSMRRGPIGVYAPRPSEPPRSVHSIPAPLLPSSHPPSSHPSGRAAAGSSPPGFAADVLEENGPKVQGEFGSELNTLLREAEQRALARHATSGGNAHQPAPQPAAEAETPPNLLDARLRAELNWALSLGIEGAVRPTAPDSNYTSASLSEATAPRNAGSQLPTIAGDEDVLSSAMVPPGTDSGAATGSGSKTSEIPGDSESDSEGEDSTNASTARPPAPRQRPVRNDPERIPTVPPAPGLPRGQWLERSLPERQLEPRPTSPPRQRGRLGRSRTSRQPVYSSVDGVRSFEFPDSSRLPQPPTPQLSAQQGGATPSADAVATAALAPGVAVHCVAEAIRNRFTGVLTFEYTETVRRIVFHDGDFVTVASGLPTESLTAYLAETGVLARSVERQLSHRLPNFGRHAGAALVAGGYLQQQQLWAALRAHAEELLSRIVRLNSGTVHTDATVPPRLGAEPSVFGGATGAEVLIELLRRSFEPEHAKERLGGSETRLQLNASSSLLDECALSEDAKADLHVALSYPLGTALKRTRDVEFACLLYALMELQCITVTARGSRRSSRQEKTRSLASAEGDAIALRQAVEVRRALVQEADYFALLGVQRSATGYTIRSAYLQLKREFDPLRIQQDMALSDLQTDVHLIQEVLDEAYGILSDAGRRERYLSAIESTSISQQA